MAAATYRDVQADLPCGHVYAGQGPQRKRNSTVAPLVPDVIGTCFCGQQFRVRIQPVLQVVGYAGTAVAP